MNDLIDNGLMWLADTLDPLLRKRGIIQDSEEAVNAATEWLGDVEAVLADIPDVPDRDDTIEAMNAIFPGGFAGFLKWRSACLVIERRAKEKRDRDLAAAAGALANGTAEV